MSWAILHSPACTAIWEVHGDEAPLWRYWGPRLPDGVVPPGPLRSQRPEPSFSLHHDVPLSLFPGIGMGWFGAPALAAHRAGVDWTHAATACEVESIAPDTLRFHLRDDVAAVEVAITVRLDPLTNVLTLSTTLTNAGADMLDVTTLAAACLPLPQDAAQVLSYTGRHNGEFVAIEDNLTRSGWRRENRRGLTSHDAFPGAIVTCADGAAYGAQLAWSGNHAQSIDWVDDGRRQWLLGEGYAPGEIRLAPGESITTPEVLATVSVQGIDGVSQAFHRAIRAHMTWPNGTMAPRPVHLNTWEGFYFDHDLTALKELATQAAEAGIERFVLDDGWFAGRDDDTTSLGDWWPDAAKYPDGLAPLADHVAALGMEFGLWVEPEMVNPDSDLYRAHPDWALHVRGRPLLAARNQLVLDMNLPAVRDYLFDAIAALLRDLPIAYLKWDHNRDLTHSGDHATYRAQVLGTYALMARLRATFPSVEIESCAGGGGRIDAGIVAHTHRFWTSDCIDAISRVSIQRGFLRFMPPELMGSHVGACPAHSTGRMQNMAFRSGVALPGHFGVELDLRQLNAADRTELAGAIARYKTLRGRFHQGQVWQGSADDHVLWQAHGTPHDLLLHTTRIAPTAWRHAPHLCLPMLDPTRLYRVTPEGGEPVEVAGSWLIHTGLALPPMAGESVLIHTITAL